MHTTIAISGIPSRQRPSSTAPRITRLLPVPILLCCVFLAPRSALAVTKTTLAALVERQSGELFGYSVATGDVNGDGKKDVIVGAYKHANPGESLSGAVYIYLGGSSLSATPDVTILGDDGDNLGYTVAAGDVNGDGYADVITGAFAYDGGNGEVRVYFGGSPMNTTVDWEIEGTSGEALGYLVAYAGDVDGDTYGDIIVGTFGGSYPAYVYRGGGPNRDSTPDMTLTDDSFVSVGAAGDVNGDGKADVVVGGSNDAYLYFGASPMNSTLDKHFRETGSDGLGVSVASGDVNGDGKSDLIVGANFSSKAYLYFGATAVDTVSDRTYLGEAQPDQFGYSVASVGDVNGDGSADVLVGAPYLGGSETGKWYFYYGGPSADASADKTTVGAAHELLGYAVAGGDVNGDGHGDLILGVYPYAGGTEHVYVLSLNSLPDAGQSFYVPQTGTVASPTEGAGAIADFYTCPNNDALPNNARIMLVVKDAGGNRIGDIAASEMDIRFNGGTAAQGFSGSYADSIIANYQYNQNANCPDVRNVPSDAPSDANGVAYLTFQGASANNPGVAVRDASRKWGHYDTEIPVYALGVQLQGRLTSNSSNGSYVLQIKNVDVASGLTTAANQGELLNSLDSSPMQSHQGQSDSAAAINWWLDLDSDGDVDSHDNQLLQDHMNHKCNTPNNP